jgi:hypothetical protein
MVSGTHSHIEPSWTGKLLAFQGAHELSAAALGPLQKFLSQFASDAAQP